MRILKKKSNDRREALSPIPEDAVMNEAFDVMLISPENRDELSASLYIKDGGQCLENFRDHGAYWVEFYMPELRISAKLDLFKEALNRAEHRLKDRLEAGQIMGDIA